MAPSHVVERELHGQLVLVKVYPAPVDREVVKWARSSTADSRFSVDTMAYEEPMSSATKRSLANPSPSARYKGY